MGFGLSYGRVLLFGSNKGTISGISGNYLLDVDSLILYDKNGFYLIPVV